MVLPAWPPMTGTATWLGSARMASAKKVLARTTSRVVTPNTRAALSTPRDRKTSWAMGTVELTGFCGQGRWSAEGLRHGPRRAHGRVQAPRACCTHRDDVDPRVGAGVGDGLAEGPHDARVDVEEVVPGHAGLAGHPSRDDHQVAPPEGV